MTYRSGLVGSERCGELMGYRQHSPTITWQNGVLSLEGSGKVSGIASTLALGSTEGLCPTFFS